MEKFMKNWDIVHNIWYFINAKSAPLRFILDYDTNDKFLFTILNRYYADVFDLNEYDWKDYSMVLSKPNTCTFYHPHIPAFDIKYIQDCLELQDYPNPTKYVIKSSCPVNYTRDEIMNCWFHHNVTWSNLKDSLPPAPQPVVEEIHPIKIQKAISVDSSEGSGSSLPENNDSIITRSSTITKKSVNEKKTRMPYCYQEDLAIIEYIVKHNHAFDVNGTMLWRKMERANVCKIRSWQSMKGRYIKHIKWDINSGGRKYPSLLPADVKLLKQGLNMQSIKKTEKLTYLSKIQQGNLLVSDDSLS